MKNIKSIGYGFAVVAAASALAAPNLIPNPGFELPGAQPVQFTSDYSYNSVTLVNPETYFVGSPGNTLQGAFNNTPAHSGSNFLVVNGSQDVSKIVWGATIPAITPSTVYFFEGWLTALHPNNPALLSFEVQPNGVGGWLPLVTSAALPTQANAAVASVWQATSVNWVSGAADTSVKIRLRNAQPAFSGNDFGVDDLNFSITSQVPEAQTLAAAAAMVGVAGLTILRRRNRA